MAMLEWKADNMPKSQHCSIRYGITFYNHALTGDCIWQDKNGTSNVTLHTKTMMVC
jgi:hypothetical protein